MGNSLSWDLGSLVSYAAGGVIELKATFSAPEDGKYYLLGALYTTNLVYIDGTMFGVLLASGETVAVNSPTLMSTWEMEEDDENEQDCKFTFNRTNVILGLFLMKLAGEEPSLDDDETIDSVSTSLIGEAEEEQAFDIGSIMAAIIPIMMISVIVGMVVTKD